MITRKKIIGVAVFIFAGLLVYTFASPNQSNVEVENESGNSTSPVVDTILTDEKTNAINELNNYVNLENYRENEQNEIDSLIEEGTTNINNATTNEEINSALEDAKEKIDEVPTNMELSARERTIAINGLDGLLDYVKEEYTSVTFSPYNNLVNRVTRNGVIYVDGLTTNEIIEITEDLETAIDNLVLLNLESITINPSEKEYKRLEEQGSILGYAVYNDETRNENVSITTEDIFDSSVVVAEPKEMTYSYTNLYGTKNTKTAIFTYTVVNNDKDNSLKSLQELFNEATYNELDYTSVSYVGYKQAYDAINALVINGVITVSDEITKENIDTLRTNLETAIDNLVLLNLESITINPSEKEYKRLEEQGSILGYAVYNDETRNENVSITTEDIFDSSVVIAESKEMTYSYTNLYGTKNTKTAIFTYTVVNNDKDNSLKSLQELFNEVTYNELDYTSASYVDYKQAYDAINVLVINGVITVSDEITKENIDTLRTNLETAIDNLVLLNLESITINPSEKEYKRLEEQGSILGYAVYNDETRNENVSLTTEDIFDSSVVAESKEMTYSYTNLYGTKNTKTAIFTYTVKLNDYDLALIQAKKDAKEELKKYNDDVIYGNKQDKVNEIKENGYIKIDESTTLENVEEKLIQTKEEIDKLGNIYTIKFIEYNKTTTKKVVAGIGIEAPEADATYKTKINSIEYKFIKWSTDEYKTNISSNLDVIAEYEIITVYVNIYVKEPTNQEILDELDSSGFDLEVNKYGYYLIQKKNTIKLNLTDEIKEIIKNDITVDEISKNNIISYIKDSSKMPSLTLNNKYYKIIWTVFKYEKSDGFHIDGEIVFDYDSFINNEINRYLGKNENDYTSASYTQYKSIINEISDLNLKEQSVSKLISLSSNLKTAYNNLIKLELVSIKLSQYNMTYQRTNTNSSLNIIVTAIYNDITKNKDVTSSVEISNFDTTTLGERTATISYNSKEAKLNYEVIRSDADKTKKLSAVLSPNVFEHKQKIDNIKKYLTVNLVSEDGIDSESISNYNLKSNISTENIGQHNITIEYSTGRNSRRYTTKVPYTVVARLEKIKLSLESNKFEINKGLTGLTVTGIYSDKTKLVLNDCTNNFDSNSVGFKELTVTCGTKKDTISYSVYNDELKKIEASLDKTTYEVGDTVNATVKYTDEYGIEKTLNKRDYKALLSTAKVGKYDVTIEYKDLTDQVSYNVIEKQIVGLNKFKLSFTNKKEIEINQIESFIFVDDIFLTYADGKRENVGFERNFLATTYTTDSLKNKTPIKIEVYYHKPFENTQVSTYEIKNQEFKFLSDKMN